jgi:hypothetical protein
VGQPLGGVRGRLHRPGAGDRRHPAGGELT